MPCDHPFLPQLEERVSCQLGPGVADHHAGIGTLRYLSNAQMHTKAINAGPSRLPAVHVRPGQWDDTRGLNA